jgi:hypothetical protein
LRFWHSNTSVPYPHYASNRMYFHKTPTQNINNTSYILYTIRLPQNHVYIPIHARAKSHFWVQMYGKNMNEYSVTYSLVWPTSSTSSMTRFGGTIERETHWANTLKLGRSETSRSWLI